MTPTKIRNFLQRINMGIEEENIGISLLRLYSESSSDLGFFNETDRGRVIKSLITLIDDSERHKDLLVNLVAYLTEHRKGKTVVLVYPIDKWVLMLLDVLSAEVRNLGDVRWLATEDRSAGKGTGRHIACFILEGK